MVIWVLGIPYVPYETILYDMWKIYVTCEICWKAPTCPVSCMASTLLWMASKTTLNKTTSALVKFLLLLLLLSTVYVGSMNQVQFDFSLKNIPIPRKEDYLTELISSVSFFVSNLRFKVWHFLNPINANDKKETYGFRTTQPAPSVAEIKNFENAIYDFVKNVKFN